MRTAANLFNQAPEMEMEMGFRTWVKRLARGAAVVSFVAQAQVPAAVKPYLPLEKLPKHLRRLPLPRFARSVKIVPDPVKFLEAQVSENHGITFQRGEMNPKLNYQVPFCTIKLANDPTTHAYYHSFVEVIPLIAAQPIISSAVVTIDGRGTSNNFTTMIYVNEPKKPQVSQTVELVQCMVAKNNETLYREPSAAELMPVFGPWAKVYIQLR